MQPTAEGQVNGGFSNRRLPKGELPGGRVVALKPPAGDAQLHSAGGATAARLANAA